jgi:hypothetical protein
MTEKLKVHPISTRSSNGHIECRFGWAQTGFAMIRLTATVLLAFGLAPTPLQATVPACVAEMAEAIPTHDFGDTLPICPIAAAPWDIRLHRHTIGQMTDGTALGILHMPQPDDIPYEDRPLPVVLLPRSQNVWSIGYMYRGEVLPERVGQRYFLWAPGNNNRRGFTPDEVDWGDAAARMFRCLTYKEESCITYYPIGNCRIEEAEGTEFMLSVRRQDSMDVIDMLDTFEPADKLARVATEAARAALCERYE